MNDRVSVIMPAFACEAYIGQAIRSVQAQTYEHWRLIVVDDASPDRTAQIVADMAREDGRIRLIQNERNQGAALCRNRAIEEADGRYLAFLDGDDLWKPDKLTRQLAWMREHGFAFSCTAYDKIDETGAPLRRMVHTPRVRDYRGVLKSCPGNSTVVYDTSVVPKQTIPDIRKRNDYAMWLKVVKRAGTLGGLDEPLSSHRVRPSSLSSNKLALVRYHWRVYREFEGLGLPYSAYLVAYWVVKGALGRSGGRRLH